MLENALNVEDKPSEIKVWSVNEDYGFEICSIKSEQNKFLLVFTRGSSNTPQRVNEEHQDLAQIELYFCLPEYFNLETEAWPIKWLEKIAAIPQKNSTWLGIGDSIPAGNPPEALSEQFACNHFIIREPKWMSQFLKQPSGIKFLAVFPIFQEELDFKLRNSHTVLFKKLENKEVTEMVDIYRTSVCRKRLFGMI